MKLSSHPEVELSPCDPSRDGPFIRALTRENFFEAMRATWDDARHEREPVHPERYQMVRRGDETIGFLALRREPDVLYVQTIQLVVAVRGHGIGTAVMAHVAQLARDAGLRAVRLRVLRVNDGARRLYERLGYRAVEEDDASSILELSV